jgi:membrane-associated phospholipid phosphatase
MSKPTPTGLNSKWGTYFYWVFWISIAFFTVYPLCNWLTSKRDSTFDLFFSAELTIPFVPEFIWAYLSLYLLFIIPPFFLSRSRLEILGKQLLAATIFSGIIFLLFPATLGFERSIPLDSFYSALFDNLFAVDLPHNMVPSLHVAFSALILLTLAKHVEHISAKTVFRIWLVLICVSTILVHQHHMLDVATGLFVAVLFNRTIGKGEHHV